MSVRLIWITPEAEKHILYCARVSSSNQDSSNTGLLKYLINHKHWSPFEMAHMCVEIHTTRAIAAQILRHRSFSFQEFSQRYAKVSTCVPTTPRRQDTKNRQNSFDDLDADVLTWWDCAENSLQENAIRLYNKALHKGVAKESARMLLPLSVQTKMYMVGSIRSWIHYIAIRAHKDTQKEHRDIAEQIKSILKEQLPVIKELI